MDKMLLSIAKKMRNPDFGAGIDITYDEVENYYKEIETAIEEFKTSDGEQLKNYSYWGIEFIYVMKTYEKLGAVKKIDDHYYLVKDKISMLSGKRSKFNLEGAKTEKAVWKYPLLKELINVYQEREAWKEKHKQKEEVLREDGSVDTASLF